VNLKTEANKRHIINIKTKNKARVFLSRKPYPISLIKGQFKPTRYQKKRKHTPKIRTKRLLLGTLIKDTTHNSLLLDLQSTLSALKQSLSVIESISKDKGSILVVGTREEYKKLLYNYAVETNQPFFSMWSSGNLTNWAVSSRSVLNFGKRLRSMELADWQRDKLLSDFLLKFGGVLLQRKKPSLVIFLNAQDLSKPINEALSAGIPSMGLISTGGNPRALTYPIPANDSFEVAGLFLMWVKKAIKKGIDSRDSLQLKQTLLQAQASLKKIFLSKKKVKKPFVKKPSIKKVVANKSIIKGLKKSVIKKVGANKSTIKGLKNPLIKKRLTNKSITKGLKKPSIKKVVANKSNNKGLKNPLIKMLIAANKPFTKGNKKPVIKKVVANKSNIKRNKNPLINKVVPNKTNNKGNKNPLVNKVSIKKVVPNKVNKGANKPFINKKKQVNPQLGLPKNSTNKGVNKPFVKSKNPVKKKQTKQKAILPKKDTKPNFQKVNKKTKK